MNITWKPANPYGGIGEDVWILEGRMGFLVTNMTGKWVIFCSDQTTRERKIYVHDCRDMADGKAIVEAQIRRLAN